MSNKCWSLQEYPWGVFSGMVGVGLEALCCFVGSTIGALPVDMSSIDDTSVVTK